jgi:hypothetical protein
MSMLCQPVRFAVGSSSPRRGAVQAADDDNGAGEFNTPRHTKEYPRDERWPGCGKSSRIEFGIAKSGRYGTAPEEPPTYTGLTQNRKSAAVFEAILCMIVNDLPPFDVAEAVMLRYWPTKLFSFS